MASSNLPGVATRWKCESTTTTRPCAKSVAYNAGWLSKNDSASPLNTAPGTVSSVRADVCTGSVSVQAVTVPASESKMNFDGTRMSPTLSLNPLVGLNTWPVGAPPGTETTNGTWVTGLPCTEPEYSVARLVPLSATHSGVVGPAASPHGFTRWESVSCALPGMSLTRLI